MKLIPQEKLNKALDKALLKHRPLKSEISLFKAELVKLIDRIDHSEREEFNKNLVGDFLKNAIYKDNFINTKGTQDLVIHNGRDNKTTVGVIIEAKRPTNKVDWFTPDKPNSKALQELVLYYLRERIECNNIDIKYLIATNINEWYIIDASYFDKLFYKNKQLVKHYEEWRDGKKVTKDTGLFYNDIAKPFIDGLTDELPCTYFNLKDHEKALRNIEGDNNRDINALFKILSPYHLLKASLANDSNELDDKFYKELLHIIGLEEAKEDGKNIIRRKKENKNPASLLEKAIDELKTEGLHKVPDLKTFGGTSEEQYFSIALELCITWVNRVLFLKLLEGQLINYHKGDQQHRFLNTETIHDFDELFKLFHKVLAVNVTDRTAAIQQKYSRVPYLNSSLFEISDLEDVTIKINSLDSSDTLDFIGSTVLKEYKKKNTKLKTLDYLFQFLDAYDFASEDTGDTKDDNKTLINASVLGKVFEKINGYKDGSVYTPGFITMYMSRQSVRLAVVQKFNEANNWTCNDFESLKEFIEYQQPEARNKANAIINDLKICDPAVGSGHFLVSVLNEIIAIKGELNILQDINGARLKAYNIDVVNDELIITDEDADIFTYNPKSPQSQLIQQTLFVEKQTIIENCLFGVDINPNSVKICRLRLWIELLKNAYYKQDGNLETLPNIDINIKCGNSLLSRFAFDADLSKALKSIEYDVPAYRGFVNDYKNCKDRDTKRGLQSIIDSIKADFKTNIDDPFKSKISKARGDLTNLASELNRKKQWGEKVPKELKDKIEKAKSKLEKLEFDKGAIISNVIYKNAFEWRFEFPEVLNNNGDFEGFDVVIANPPYVFARENFTVAIKDYFTDNYKTSQYQVNLFLLFIERAIPILKNKGQFTMIIPNSLLMVSSARNLRQHLLQETSLHEIINLMGHTFEGINVETIIISGEKENKDHSNKIGIYLNKGTEFILSHRKEQNLFMQNEGSELTIFSNTESDELTSKLKVESQILDNLVKIKAGLQAYETGKGNPKQTPEDVKARPYDYTYKFDQNTHEYLEGKDVGRYQIKWSGTYLKYGNNLASPRTIDIFSGEKIIIREITGKHPQSIIATYSEDIYLFNRSNIAIVTNENSTVSLKYILAILNSKLMSHYFMKNTAKSVRQLFPKLILEDLRKFPIKPISSQKQQPIVVLVDRVLEGKKRGEDTTTLEQQIDKLVYQLYDLTPDEITIIEAKT
jgi:adenine-specific DNA-methyltransferase